MQVSDTHISDNWHGPENKYNNALNDFVNTINSQTNHPKPGFVIFTGDNIEGALRTITEGCGNDKKVAGTTAEAFQDFKSIADGLQAPYYLLTHNHDTMSHREHWYDENSSRSSKCEWGKIEHDNGAGYIEVFGSEPYNGTTGDKFNYYWTQGSFLFVVQGVKHGGNPDNNWLNDVLKTNKDKKVFYFTHANAIYSRDDKGPNSNLGCECSSCSTFYLKKNGTLINTLKTHGNVLISFAGHDHMTSAGQHKNGERFLSSSDHLTFDSPDDMIYTTVAANFEGGVYKYVEVYSDRVKVRTESIGGKYPAPNWRSLCDSMHSSKNVASGLPQEQNFTLSFEPVDITNAVPTATVTVDNPSPVKTGNIQVTLTTSKLVTTLPSLLVFNESDSSTTTVNLNGSVPGTVFTGILVIDQSVADGQGYFSLPSNALVDENGKVGNQITSGASVKIAVPPKGPMNVRVKVNNQ